MRASQSVGPLLGTVAAFALFSAGCASLGQRMQRWEGHPINELIADHGPADRIVAYPYGGRLYIWESERASLMPADATARRLGPRVESVRHREIALVDDAGVIVHTEVESVTLTATPPASS